MVLGFGNGHPQELRHKGGSAGSSQWRGGAQFFCAKHKRKKRTKQTCNINSPDQHKHRTSPCFLWNLSVTYSTCARIGPCQQIQMCVCGGGGDTPFSSSWVGLLPYAPNFDIYGCRYTRYRLRRKAGFEAVPEKDNRNKNTAVTNIFLQSRDGRTYGEIWNNDALPYFELVKQNGPQSCQCV